MSFICICQVVVRVWCLQFHPRSRLCNTRFSSAVCLLCLHPLPHMHTTACSLTWRLETVETFQSLQSITLMWIPCTFRMATLNTFLLQLLLNKKIRWCHIFHRNAADGKHLSSHIQLLGIRVRGDCAGSHLLHVNCCSTVFQGYACNILKWMYVHW